MENIKLNVKVKRKYKSKSAWNDRDRKKEKSRLYARADYCCDVRVPIFEIFPLILYNMTKKSAIEVKKYIL